MLGSSTAPLPGAAAETYRISSAAGGRTGPFTRAVEPDVPLVFRRFMVAQLLLLSLWVGLQQVEPRPAASPFQALALVVPALVLGAFAYNGLQRWLGRAFLPLALLVASAGPLVTYAVIVRWRIEAGVAADVLLRDAWLLIVALLLPCILVAWQYGWRAVLLFCIAAALIDSVLLLPLAGRGGPPAATVIGVALVRVLFFLPVGFAVARLVAAQRAQREALASAHAQLLQHTATLEELTVSRERNRLARELHDTLAHTLSALVVQMEAIGVLAQSDPVRARALLADAQAGARAGLREARRAIAALRATQLEALGFVGALGEAVRAAAGRADLAFHLSLPTALELASRDTEQAVYRIVEEALANVVQHAAARNVSVRFEPTPPRLIVSDDGVGFEPARVDTEHHFGLRGAHERALLAGAVLRVDSAPGAGTRVEITLPEQP